MATKNERLDLVRNVVTELDKEIKTANGVLEMIKEGKHYEGEIQQILQMDWESHLRVLKNLRDFVIYKA